MAIGKIVRQVKKNRDQQQRSESRREAPAERKPLGLEKILEGLNPEQQQAVQHYEGPLLVAAVAGAGKTKTVICRIAHLVEIHDVDPTEILAVTFSRKGAQEMQERLDAMLPGHGARIGTFHSLALQILRAEVEEYQTWKIDDRNRYHYIIKDAVDYQGMDWKDADVTLIEQFIGFAKACMLDPDAGEPLLDLAKKYAARSKKKHVPPPLLVEAYRRAELLRKERQILTFDDMVKECAVMLREHDGIRRRWAARWRFVIQDEAQDQNLCQLEMGELLAQDHRNYMLVGDPGQTIFTWRGAQPDKLLGFESGWKANVIRMHRNYRCGSVIIDAANAAIQAMDPATRLDMTMTPERGIPGHVTSKQYMDLDDEGQGIAERIQQGLADGMEPRDFVILYRTNAQSRAPEEALIGERIPYQIIGGTCFYERREVKCLLSYLRLAAGTGKIDDIAYCINAPFRYLGKRFVDRLRAAAKESPDVIRSGRGWGDLVCEVADQAGIQRRQQTSAEDWAGLIEDVALRIAAGGSEGLPHKILDDIVRETKYIDWLKRDEGEESPENSRVSNIREMIRAAERFPTVHELLDYVDKTIAASKETRKSKEDPNKVTLCSLHRAKGLEWPVVFLAGCVEGILPHGRAEEPEEELRLFYVGVTRARDELNISCPQRISLGNRVAESRPSEFLAITNLMPVSAYAEEIDGSEEPPVQDVG